MSYIENLGKKAKEAKRIIGTASPQKKNQALQAIADELMESTGVILAQNALDLEKAKENGMSVSMQDRLALTADRIKGMADGVLALIKLDDPVESVISGMVRPNGLKIMKTRVPLGVIGIIYESRPNVTVDAAALCLKAGNAVILRGGKEAYHSNKVLVELMQKAVSKAGFLPEIIQFVDDTTREVTTELMRCSEYLDVLIPRGGAGLIQAVLKNATVPVIETGTGNCHAYVDASADLSMAVDIVENGKTSRPSVCNALESLLVHESVAEEFLPMAAKRLQEHGVELRGCKKTCEILGNLAVPATEEDFGTEFLDYILSVKVVSGIDEAIGHIAKFSTGHSETIITNDLRSAERFQREVDSAAVYVNASTRFTDGGEFGLGAEIGISTQKLHARGPMGLNELTSVKYLIEGNGQVR